MDDHPEIDLIKYFSIVWKRRYVILLLTGICAITAVVYSLVATQYYRAETIILPNIENTSDFRKMATALGFFAEKVENPSQLYPKVLRSKRILKKVIYLKYQTAAFDGQVNLIEYWYGKEDLSPDEKLEMMYRRLREGVITITVDKNTGVITVAVVTREPGLSAAIANNMIRELDRYNRDYKQIKAKEQRQFVEERLREEKSELTAAENQLKRFREKNRRVIDSPALLLEQERMVREVELHNTLYVELKKQYELVKIEEVKNTPVVDVLDRAEPPIKRFKPKRKLIVLLSSLLSFLSAVFIVLTMEYIQNNIARVKAVIKNK